GINLAGLDVGQEACQGRPVHVATAEAAVVIVLGQTDPAFVGLAFDVGFGRFALGLQGCEFLLGALLGRFAGVDSTADSLESGGAAGGFPFAHGLLLWWLV